MSAVAAGALAGGHRVRARNALDQAERDVDRGLAVAALESPDAALYPMVAVHWLKGLLRLAAGDTAEAMASFDQELALEGRGHLYAREAAANTWYAKGACYLAAGDRDAADSAFRQALARVPGHPLAQAGLAILNGEPAPAAPLPSTPEPVDQAVARAERLVHANRVSEAVPIVSAALNAAPPGNGGWLLAVEPLLRVGHHPDVWARALAVVPCARADRTGLSTYQTHFSARWTSRSERGTHLSAWRTCFSAGGHSPQRTPDSPQQGW